MPHLSGGRGVSPLKTQIPDAEKPPATESALNRLLVETPVGDAEAVLDLPRGVVAAVLVIGHGAGGDIETPDIVTLRDAALRARMAVARVRQPYRVLGRRAPAPARQLDAAWLCVVQALRETSGPFTPYRRKLRGRSIVVSGRSSGARVACRTAAECCAAGVIACAFPLHPPGRPDRSRADELETGVPLIVAQGVRDPFGAPADFPYGVRVIGVEGSDHGLKSAAFVSVAGDLVDWAVTLQER